MLVRQKGTGYDREFPLDRNLRLWANRFQEILKIAAISALKLDRHPYRSDSYGMVISLLPRPHSERGACFVIDGVSILQLSVLHKMFENLIRNKNMYEDYKRQRRDMLKNRHYAHHVAILVIAYNEGEHMIYGDLPVSIRFKPLPISKEMVEIVGDKYPWKMGWDMALRLQVRDVVDLRTSF